MTWHVRDSFYRDLLRCHWRSCSSWASEKNWKSRKTASCKRSEKERPMRGSRRRDSVPITRRRNSEGAFWYLENDAPYLRRTERKERATQERKEGQKSELSRKKHMSSVPTTLRCRGLNGWWGETKEDPSISLIRSPRRPPGFRNAKHLLLLIGQSTRLTPLRPSNPLLHPAAAHKQAPTDCSSLVVRTLNFGPWTYATRMSVMYEQRIMRAFTIK